MEDAALQSLHAGLARADARRDEVLARIAASARTDLAGLPPGAAALLLSRGELGPTLVLTGDGDKAVRAAEDLRFFLGGDRDQVLLYPSLDTTPFLDVAPDRRTAMDRLATLFHLTRELPWRFLVAPAPAVLRRVPPKAAVDARSLLIEAEGELE
ncbi:MAG TPA: hypothetical protein RMH80_18560, partial [Polyangiaceae bacterium LLY-WYZ-15_(1-7)]|nr:hypothetical protein [Polyangiaceae bacterium LLY-WYZ-15_(1-7)]